METQKGQWGGKRPGAGRPRTETLDAVEAGYLAELLEQQPEAEQFAELVAKLHRIADKAALTH